MDDLETTTKFLRSLASRLMQIPVMYGTDQSDVDNLLLLARKLETESEETSQ